MLNRNRGNLANLADQFGIEYLQRRILAEFPLARHMDITVDSVDDTGIVLHAPLAANANYKGTAFGGSLFSVAVLTGWAWATRYLAAHDCSADAVIQESTMRYLSPVTGTLCASLVTPPVAQIEKFTKMLQRAGRGRLLLEVRIHQGQRVAAVFEGAFAAAIR
jgi:thioesterase domain-containing protein